MEKRVKKGNFHCTLGENFFLGKKMVGVKYFLFKYTPLQKYDLKGYFWPLSFLCKFPIFWLSGSASLILIRIRVWEAKMMRIRPDPAPDPHRCCRRCDKAESESTLHQIASVLFAWFYY